MHTDSKSHSEHKQAKAHTYIHTLGVNTPDACFLRTTLVVMNSFPKPCDFPSPAEIRAVMATEENSGCSMRACLLRKAAPEQRIEMQQKSGLKELVCECVSNYHSEASKGYQNNEVKNSPLCDDTVSQ